MQMPTPHQFLFFLIKVLTSICLLLPLGLHAQVPSLAAFRIDEAPHIDGQLSEPYWQAARSDDRRVFTQREPNNGAPSTQETRVQVAYDDQALYVAARMYDDQPDSIQTQLGLRDSRGLNADMFMVALDPYNQQQAAFQFYLSAAGMQLDAYRTLSDWDRNWDAVWNSAVHIDSLGWTAEIRIPYSAIRFPPKDIQTWGVNFWRKIARTAEETYWSPVDANQTNQLAQYGQLRNLEGITPPLRLSALPFVSSYYNHQDGEGSMSLTGGMDIKYGVNESFTLDMSLVPDFGQVRSDNVVLNLSPFEVRFDENRPFFTEGTELFNQGGLFYSRRVGSAYGLSGELRPHEVLAANMPQQAPMLNATKFSGRTEGGTGVGIFNSLTNRTLVTARDTLTDRQREVQADPLTNFNVMVVDQNLKNNSRVSLVNTNVMRSGSAIDANVTGAFFAFFDPSNTWRVAGSTVMSQRFGPDMGENGVELGHAYSVEAGKISGRWQFELSHRVESDSYDINDLGFLRAANEVSYQGRLRYRVNEPFGPFNRTWSSLRSSYRMTYLPREYDQWGVDLEVGGQLRNQWSGEISFGANPVPRHNHFEPRTSGYIFIQPESFSTRFWLGTDRRKPFRISMNGGVWTRPEWEQVNHWLNLRPRLRLNDHLTLSHSLRTSWRRKEIGFIDRTYTEGNEVASVVMGRRDVQNIINTFSGSYNFNALMGLSLRVRHYWSKVGYDRAYDLVPSGEISPSEYPLTHNDGTPRHDRNFNAFNVDLVYNWQFAPGSMLTFVWKNAIYTDDPDTTPTFTQNLSHTLAASQLNSLSVRVRYFLDYQDVQQWRKG